MEVQRQYLSKSMEKTFLKLKSRPSARHAFVEAEVVTGLAHQIRAMRLQRGWTQADLAKVANTTQAAISRLEDPSYGRPSLTTLIELAKVFDTGMQVRYVSLVTMLSETFVPSAHARLVPSFIDECEQVDFYTPMASMESTKPLQFQTAAVTHTFYPGVRIQVPAKTDLYIEMPALPRS